MGILVLVSLVAHGAILTSVPKDPAKPHRPLSSALEKQERKAGSDPSAAATDATAQVRIALEAQGQEVSESDITRALTQVGGNVQAAVNEIMMHVAAFHASQDPADEGDVSQVPDLRSQVNTLSKSIFNDAAEYRQLIADAYSDVRKEGQSRKDEISADNIKVQNAIQNMKIAMNGLGPALTAMGDMARGPGGMGGITTNVERLMQAISNTGTRAENMMLVPKGGATVASAMEMATNTAQDAIDMAYAEAGNNDDAELERLVDDLRRKEQNDAKDIMNMMDDGKRDMSKLYKDIKSEDLRQFQATRYALSKLIEDEKISYKESQDLITKDFPKLLSATARKDDKWMQRAEIVLSKEAQLVAAHTRLAEKKVDRQHKDLSTAFKLAIQDWERHHEDDVRKLAAQYKDMMSNVKTAVMEEDAAVKRNQGVLSHEQDALGEKLKVSNQEATQLMLDVLKSVKQLDATSRDADASITAMGNKPVTSAVDRNLGYNFPYSATAQQVVSELERKTDGIKEEHASDFQTKQEKFQELESKIYEVTDKLMAAEAKLDSEQKAQRQNGKLTPEQENAQIAADGEAQLNAAHSTSEAATLLVEKKLQDIMEQTRLQLKELASKGDAFRNDGFAAIDAVDQKVRPVLSTVEAAVQQFEQAMRAQVPVILAEKNRANGVLGAALKEVEQTNQQLDALEEKLRVAKREADKGRSQAYAQADALLEDVRTGAQRAKDEAQQLESVAGGEIRAEVGQLQTESADAMRGTAQEVAKELESERLKVKVAAQNSENTQAKLKALADSTMNSIPSVEDALTPSITNAKEVDTEIVHLTSGADAIQVKAKQEQEQIKEDIKHKVDEIIGALKAIGTNAGSEMDGDKLRAIQAAEEKITALVTQLTGQTNTVSHSLDGARKDEAAMTNEVQNFQRDNSESFADLLQKLARLDTDFERASQEAALSVKEEQHAIGSAKGPMEDVVREAAVRVAEQAMQQAQAMLSSVTAKVDGATETDAKTLKKQEEALRTLEVSLKSAISHVSRDLAGSEQTLQTAQDNTVQMASHAAETLAAAEARLRGSNPTAQVDSVEEKAEANAERTKGTLDALSNQEKTLSSEAVDMAIPMTAAKRKSEVTGLEGKVEALSAGEKLAVEGAVHALEQGVGPFDDQIKTIHDDWASAMGDEKKKRMLIQEHGAQLLENVHMLTPAFRKALHGAETEDATKMAQVYDVLARTMTQGMRIMDATERHAREHEARDKIWGEKTQEVMKSDAYQQLNSLYEIDKQIKEWTNHLLKVDEWAHNHSNATWEWRKDVDRAFRELNSDYRSNLGKLEFERHSAEQNILQSAKNEEASDEEAINSEGNVELQDVADRGAGIKDVLASVRENADAKANADHSSAEHMQKSEAATFADYQAKGSELASKFAATQQEVEDNVQASHDVQAKVKDFLGEQEAGVSNKRTEYIDKLKNMLQGSADGTGAGSLSENSAEHLRSYHQAEEAEEAKHHALLEQHKSLKQRMLSLLGHL